MLGTFNLSLSLYLYLDIEFLSVNYCLLLGCLMNHYNVHNKYRLNKTQFSIIYFYCHFVNVFCKLLTAAGNILPPFLPFLKSLREKRDGRKRTKLGSRRIQNLGKENMTNLKESAKIKKKMELRNIFSTTIFF